MGDIAEWQDSLAGGAAELGLQIDEEQRAAYRLHFELLLAHNERAALTSLSDPGDIAVRHYLDSLTCLLARDIGPGERVADVGSGAGFPGIVLAVARPDASYQLIESTRKRAAFLRTAVQALGLHYVSITAARAEETGQDPDHRECYDLVLSRAVAPLPVLLEYCLPLLRVGGQFLGQKGPEAQKELDHSGPALSALGGQVGQLRSLSLPRQAGRRVLIVIEKTEPTPAKFPRRPGIPAKRPLK
jgi:16S rRNA (guanine527-N7)-methyltransferase